MLPKSIIQYLQKHPDFLANYPEAILSQTLPIRVVGDNLSIADYQLEQLQSQYQALKYQLDELIKVAKFNEESQLKTHQLVLDLMQQKTLSGLHNLLEKKLLKQFNLSEAKIITWQDSQIEEKTQNNIRRYIDESSSYFGHINPEEAAVLFKKPFKSAALVPLKTSKFGLLAFASQDERFLSQNISDILLSLIAATTYTVLSRL